MAKSTTKTAGYDAATTYAVRLARPATVAGHKLLPRHRHEMTGEFLTTLTETEGADIVASATAL